MATATKVARTMPRPYKGPNVKTYNGRVAARFRALRLEHEWTVEEAWHKLDRAGIDTTVAAIRSWESGYRDMPSNYWPIIAKKVFGMKLFEFLPPE